MGLMLTLATAEFQPALERYEALLKHERGRLRCSWGLEGVSLPLFKVQCLQISKWVPCRKSRSGDAMVSLDP